MITFSVSVHIEGLASTAVAVKRAAKEGAVTAATAGLAEARRRVRVGATHALVDGLQLMPGPEDQIGFGVDGVREASYQENGTYKMHAQPYMGPGASIARRVLPEAVSTAVRAVTS